MEELPTSENGSSSCVPHGDIFLYLQTSVIVYVGISTVAKNIEDIS